MYLNLKEALKAATLTMYLFTYKQAWRAREERAIQDIQSHYSWWFPAPWWSGKTQVFNNVKRQ